MAAWQSLKDFGLDIFKKRSRSRTLWIGGSVSFFSLIALLLILTGVTVSHSGDSDCKFDEQLGMDVCEAYINVTSTYWRICFTDEFKFVQTIPDIRTEVYVPARGKGNWRLFDPSKDCIERKTKYRTLPNRFKVVGYKEFDQTVKWSVDRFSVDPIWHGVNISKIKGNCVNHTQNTYHIVTYNYTCQTDNFDYQQNPYKYAWCYNDTVLGNGTYPIVFKHTFDRGNLPNKYIEWDIREKNGTETTTTCEVIGYQIKNKKLMFENFPFRCWLNTADKCVECKSLDLDGDGRKPIKKGDGTSWCSACIVNDSIVDTCRSDSDFMRYWGLA